jgi:hypothetical protein
MGRAARSDFSLLEGIWGDFCLVRGGGAQKIAGMRSTGFRIEKTLLFKRWPSRE